MNDFFKNKVVKEILESYKTLWALSHASSVMSWDHQTYMPSEGATSRGMAQAKLSSLYQKLFLDPKFTSLIKKANEESGLNDYEAGVVRQLTRALHIYEKLPSKFIEEWEEVTSKASMVWRKAKVDDDFASFAPHLTKIFDLAKRKSDYLGYTDNPYDPLLDSFENDLKTKEVEEFFAKIKPEISSIYSSIKSSASFKKVHPLVTLAYNREKLSDLNLKVLGAFGADFSRFRVDDSAHPMTISMGAGDTRITTWYQKADFSKNLSATVHEFGHALYDMQIAEGLSYTPLAEANSMVIHESQSHFWDTYFYKSEAFCKFILSDVAALSPEIGKYIDGEGWMGIYKYFNNVTPGLIRVEADEVTYHFHIMLRFELEKSLIEGSLKVSDLPEVWRVKMKDYLGLTPKTDRDGVLQDVHWSEGLIGYFPTYSFGNFLTGMWKEGYEKEFKVSLEEGIMEKGKIKSIKGWLKENVHKYGSTYAYKDLLKVSFGKSELDTKPFLTYLKSKYSKIYGF